jgi:glycerol kinase
MSDLILALDQGTTSSRAILFDASGAPLSTAQEEHPQIFPQPGWVEHDPEALWGTQLTTARAALQQAGVSASDVRAVGITNQRETVLLWERAPGRPLTNAIVWQDRRTADLCERMKADGLEPLIREKTGLVLDAYFSGTKIRWMLDHLPGVRDRAERSELAFGTVDTYLLWRLTRGRVHATDVSNASRTLLFNIHNLDWDDELLRLFGIPRELLPQVRPSSHLYGDVDAGLLGAEVPIGGVGGDQQAATFGQCCFSPGMVKNTYGTGSFLLMNTGTEPRLSHHRLLTTVAWQLSREIDLAAPPLAGGVGGGGPSVSRHPSMAIRSPSQPSPPGGGHIGPTTTYALEGSVFVTGAAVQWLRDELGIIRSTAETEALALSVPSNGGVYFVPAFVGLGAPYWDSDARGAVVGLTRGTGRAHLARAALEATCFQSRDVIEAMQADCGAPLEDLRVDGGMTVNNALLQMQADILGIPVHRPAVTETTALGAAYLAGLAVGVWDNCEEIAKQWKVDRTFEPRMSADERENLYAGWKKAVERVRGERI